MDNKSDDILLLSAPIEKDGIWVYKDPMTRVKKKNRRRHIKDGAPKSMRGKQGKENQNDRI